MSIWKQLVVCILLLAGAFVAWVHYDSSAVARLSAIGVDANWLAAIAPQDQQDRNPASGGGAAGGVDRSTLVVTRKVDDETLNNRLKAIGSGMAIRTVTITPTDNGTIDSLEAKAGDRVEPGQVIARLEAQAQQIAADRAKLNLADAEKKLKRYRELRSSSVVTSVQISDQESEVATDRLALKQAEYDLSKRTIRAPIGGVVGIIGVNVGDYVTTQTQLATVDDRSKILVDFQVPERFSGAIKRGAEVDATASAFPGRTFKGDVSAIDNRIDPDSRTLRVRAEIPNDDDVLRAGMSFLVTMQFPGDRYAAVDPLSVQWDSNGAYVWKVVNDKAERVNVKVVQRNAQNILVDGQVASGDRVITEGVQVLRSGSQVRIADSENDQPLPNAATQHQSRATGMTGRQAGATKAAAL